MLYTGHKKFVNVAVISNCSKYVASGGEDRLVKLWNYYTGEHIKNFKSHRNGVNSIAFNKDTTLLCSASDDETVIIWDVERGVKTRILRGHQQRIMEYILTGSYDRYCKVWNSDTGKLVRTIKGHHGGVRTIVSTAKTKQIIVGTTDSLIYIYDNKFELDYKLEGHIEGVTSISLSKCEKYLTSGSYDQTVILWDIEEYVKIQTMIGHQSMINSVYFSPNDNFIVSSSWNKKINVFNTFTGELVNEMTTDSYIVYMTYSPCGSYIIICYENENQIEKYIWKY